MPNPALYRFILATEVPREGIYPKLSHTQLTGAAGFEPRGQAQVQVKISKGLAIFFSKLNFLRVKCMRMLNVNTTKIRNYLNVCQMTGSHKLGLILATNFMLK